MQFVDVCQLYINLPVETCLTKSNICATILKGQVRSLEVCVTLPHRVPAKTISIQTNTSMHLHYYLRVFNTSSTLKSKLYK
jgi:hypothetical protein